MYWPQLNYVYKAESNTEQQIFSQSHTCVSINATHQAYWPLVP